MDNRSAVSFDFARYYNYADLSQALADLAAAYPGLAKLSSIGKSYQGRDLWLMELTSPAGPPPHHKPGYYIDAVTHPEEVSGAVVALYTAWYLLSEYGHDPLVTRLLDTQVVYIVPMVNPDAAEICFSGRYYEWHGNARYGPGEEQVGPGVHYADLNGDGFITRMRVPDPAGEWKPSEKDPRIMVPRQPYEFGGQYYRILPEGYIQDFDGAEITIPRPRDGNLNRNYPVNWAPEGEQYGAGEHPLSEPEIKAVVQFLKAHRNIVGSVNYHTNAGALLMPFHGLDEPMPPADFALFKRIGEIGAQETGYVFVSSEEQFSGKAHKPRRGTSTGFLYGEMGVICFVTELWDVYQEAGLGRHPSSEPRQLSEEDQLKLLKWNDEKLGGKSFIPWTPFDHPQLGRVEIGGWQGLYMFRNPPPALLPEMCHKNAMFTLKHALCAPCLRIRSAAVTPLGAGVFKVEAIVENVGFLSTSVTQHAVRMQAVESVRVALESTEELELVAGRREADLGHLAGWHERLHEYTRFSQWNTPARKAEWVVRVPEDRLPVTVRVHATSTRAGEDMVDVMLRKQTS